MKIPGSPPPPRMVLVAGDDQAGANIHTARARNTSRTRARGPGRSRRASRRRRRPPDSRSSGGVATSTGSTAGAGTTASVVDPMDDAGSFDNPRSSWGGWLRGAQGERKFSQYRDGVGPRCPWYFDPTPRDP